MTDAQDERRMEAQIIGEIHNLDRRISVLETRFMTTENRLEELRINFSTMHEKIMKFGEKLDEKLDTVADDLRTHMEIEQKDRIKLLTGVLGTLATAIAGFLAWALPWVWTHLESL